MKISFSIITCTYNPNAAIFNRVLKALKGLESSPLFDYEIIIVDNNSSPQLSKDPAVQDFLLHVKNAALIVETTPGLTSARLAGVKKSKYDLIVFFDDDNEPSSQYLLNAYNLIVQYREVGVWGPGSVTVEFASGGSLVNTGRIQKLFQHKNINEVLVDSDLLYGNSDAFPFGTGMIVRKNILLEYGNNVANGTYTMTDRIGKSLSSAGDTQILYTAIKMQYKAGSSPDLRINHIISAAKTAKLKLYKLLYSLNAGQIKAYNEVFPESRHVVTPPTNANCIKSVYQKFRINLKNKSSMQDTVFDIAETLGMLKARVLAGNFDTPLVLSLWEKMIGVK